MVLKPISRVFAMFSATTLLVSNYFSLFFIVASHFKNFPVFEPNIYVKTQTARKRRYLLNTYPQITNTSENAFRAHASQSDVPLMLEIQEAHPFPYQILPGRLPGEDSRQILLQIRA